jgi:hypothetical protein
VKSVIVISNRYHLCNEAVATNGDRISHAICDMVTKYGT